MTEDQIYYANQPPAIRAMMDMPDGSLDDIAARRAKAYELATQGYLIDVEIMVQGWGAGQRMAMRKQYGYTWVPSALQDPTGIAPGIVFPGLKSYDPKNPPPGSIAVISPITVESYPPFDKPPVIVEPMEKSPVGALVYGNMYAPAPGVQQSFVDGAKYNHDPRGSFVFSSKIGMFGVPSNWWTKQ